MRATARKVGLGVLTCLLAVPAMPPAADPAPAAGVLHYLVYGTVYRSDGKVFHRVNGERWARLSPPMLYMRTRWRPEVGAPGVGTQGPEEVLLDRRGTLVHDLGTGKWYFRGWSGLRPGDEDRLVASATQREIGGPDESPSVLSAASVRITPWRRTRERMGGRDVVRSQREIVQLAPGDRTWRTSEQTTVWADAATRASVRKEIAEYDLQTGTVRSRSVAEQIGRLAGAPRGTLDLAPPPSAPVWSGAGSDTLPAGSSRGAWLGLTAGDRSEVAGRIARSEAAWLRRDFARFSGEWDFVLSDASHEGKTPGYASREVWRQWVTQRSSAWAAPRSIPAAASAVRSSGQPARRPTEMIVWVLSRWRQPGLPWQLAGYHAYVLHRTRSGWRIVDWSWRPPEVVLLWRP